MITMNHVAAPYVSPFSDIENQVQISYEDMLVRERKVHARRQDINSMKTEGLVFLLKLLRSSSLGLAGKSLQR